MELRTVGTRPFEDQRPGTSGLRKTTRVFMQPHYLENFLQSIFDVMGGAPADPLIVGGDGRHLSRPAILVFLRMAAANGLRNVVVGSKGWLSTPAASCLIRTEGARGAVLFTASHNPGGPDGDFGVKVDTADGGPAPLDLTEAIFERSRRIREFRILEEVRLDFEGPDAPLGQPGEFKLGDTLVRVVDPVAPYANLLEEIFDYPLIRDFLSRTRFRVCFDAMNGITGPYASEILDRRLGMADSVIRGQPLEDFGGIHPDPNLSHAGELLGVMSSVTPPDLGSACDGDGDRAMVIGPGIYVSPSDSIAILAAHADKVPWFSGGLGGVARSMPTSRALDRVAKQLEIPCYETPTGWKHFAHLLKHRRIRLCGEESFGAGSDHLFEKDGIWAVLFWLNVLAATDASVVDLVRAHWRRFGRDFFARHDYEGLDPDAASGALDSLRRRLGALPGDVVAGLRIESADEFVYEDPIEGQKTDTHDIRIFLEGDSKIVYRVSGTGTVGVTLRVYLERYEPDIARQDSTAESALASLLRAATMLLPMKQAFGRTEADVVT